MNVLLTGATGFLGSHIVEQLLQQGFQVRCLIRSTSNLAWLEHCLDKIEIIYGNLDNLHVLERSVTHIDAVIHCAGIVKAEKAEDFHTINARGTENLLATIIRVNPALKRFVLVSSLSAGKNSIAELPTEVELISNPISHYGRSKVAAELITRKFINQLPITIIRPPAIYGPRDQSSLILFKTIHYGLIPILFGGQTSASTIYVTDAALGIIKAITSPVPSGSVYFTDDGNVLTWEQRLQEMARIISPNKQFKLPIPDFLIMTAATIAEYYSHFTHKPIMLTRDRLTEMKQPHWVCYSDRTTADLSWRPHVTWPEGIKLTYAWYKQAKWL